MPSLRLSQARSRQPDDTDVLYGRNVVLEALRGGLAVREVLVANTAHGADIADLQQAATRARTPFRLVDRAELDRLVGDRHHQGVAAITQPFAYATLDDLLAAAELKSKPPLLLVLDSLQDPQNFGTLLRCAQATGVHGVLIPEHRAVGVTPSVFKASAGAVAHLPIARATNLTRALQQLKQHNVWTYGLSVAGTRPFWEVDWRSAAAVVVGAEGAGLGRLVAETCDELVQLPMAASAVQSLNAATAGSIVLYEAFRQRSNG